MFRPFYTFQWPFSRGVGSKTNYIVKMAFIWTNSFYIFIKSCKNITSFWHITVSLTTEQFSHLNKLYIVKLIVADVLLSVLYTILNVNLYLFILKGHCVLLPILDYFGVREGCFGKQDFKSS